MIQAKGPHLKVCLVPAPTRSRPPRWQIAVPQRVIRLATARNRWKRRIREILRRNEKHINSPHLLDISVHKTGAVSFSQIESEMLQLMNQIGVMT